MTALTNDLLAQLEGAPLQQISRQLGIDQGQAAGAVSAALPLLMGALGKNASQPQGAEALLGALQRDHAGSGGDLGGLLGMVLGGAQSRQTDGAGVLGHIFGGQQARAEQSLGAATGLGGNRAGQLMKILAPIVMAYLAKRMFSGNESGGGQSMDLGGGNPTADILGAVLGQERQQVRQQGGLAGGLLGAVLDKDGDGDVDLSDMLKLGGGLLGDKRS